MLVFLNGKIIPEEQATVSVFDRSFCLGDGLFEALPVSGGKFFLLGKHIERLQAGANFLKIKFPFSPQEILEFAKRLLLENQMDDGMLRIQLSRGIGTRGYSAKGAYSPTFVMTLHPSKKNSLAAKLIVSSIRIPANDPLSKFKTCSKLSHIVARTEADDQGADEALLLNTDGDIAEATSSNFFWIENKTVCTPPVESGALPGVTRALILGLCRELAIPAMEKNVPPLLLSGAEGVFLTASGSGVREVSRINEIEFPRSAVTQTLGDVYLKYVEGSD